MKVVAKPEDVVVKEEPAAAEEVMSDNKSAQTKEAEEKQEQLEDKKVLAPKPEVKVSEEETTKEKDPEAPNEDEAMEGDGQVEEPKPKKRKRRKEKCEKKKRKLNHQCASVKICHKIMSQYRDTLDENDKKYLAKFSQLNRGSQGIMFAEMCRKLRVHLKEKYPKLEKFEDIDMSDEGRSEYQKQVEFLIKDYIESSKNNTEDAKESVPKSDTERGEAAEKA